MPSSIMYLYYLRTQFSHREVALSRVIFVLMTMSSIAFFSSCSNPSRSAETQKEPTGIVQTTQPVKFVPFQGTWRSIDVQHPHLSAPGIIGLSAHGVLIDIKNVPSGFITIAGIDGDPSTGAVQIRLTDNRRLLVSSSGGVTSQTLADGSILSGRFIDITICNAAPSATSERFRMWDQATSIQPATTVAMPRIVNRSQENDTAAQVSDTKDVQFLSTAQQLKNPLLITGVSGLIAARNHGVPQTALEQSWEQLQAATRAEVLRLIEQTSFDDLPQLARIDRVMGDLALMRAAYGDWSGIRP